MLEQSSYQSRLSDSQFPGRVALLRLVEEFTVSEINCCAYARKEYGNPCRKITLNTGAGGCFCSYAKSECMENSYLNQWLALNNEKSKNVTSVFRF